MSLYNAIIKSLKMIPYKWGSYADENAKIVVSLFTLKDHFYDSETRSIKDKGFEWTEMERIYKTVEALGGVVIEVSVIDSVVMEFRCRRNEEKVFLYLPCFLVYESEMV